MTVRTATPADLAPVLALITAEHEDALPESARAERGFLQGRWDAAKIAALADGPGIFLAEDDGELAGVAITSDAGTAALDDGPPRLTAESVTTDRPLLLYGPVVVAPEFRGRGVVRRLLAEIGRRLGERFPQAALFVDQANPTSLAVHRRLGMREHAEFSFAGRAYTVFVFTPNTFA